MPKTIDNDLSATDFTFGFHTAVQIATDAIDRLHTTAESHDRVMVVEVMGRHAGWIAIVLRASPAAPTSCSCPRSRSTSPRCAPGSSTATATARTSRSSSSPRARRRRRARSPLQSGEVDEFGHVRLGGISNVVADEIGRRTGFETRVTILGHVLRGGTPTAYDRVLATRFGIAAIDAVHDGEFGTMVALHGERIERVPIADAVRELKTVDPDLLDVAGVVLRVRSADPPRCRR